MTAATVIHYSVAAVLAATAIVVVVGCRRVTRVVVARLLEVEFEPPSRSVPPLPDRPRTDE